MIIAEIMFHIKFFCNFTKFGPGVDNLDVGVFVDAANIWGVDYDS